MNKEKQIRSVIADYRDHVENEEGRRIVPLFKADGRWSGDVMTGGYSASDRASNGDFLFVELDDDKKDIAYAVIEAACDRLSAFQRPFGKGAMFLTPIRPCMILAGSYYHGGEA